MRSRQHLLGNSRGEEKTACVDDNENGFAMAMDRAQQAGWRLANVGSKI
jgi:hypothetical protein